MQIDPWAVVLAGGEGKRLQGFLRTAVGAARPKQFCRIIGSRTMLRHTWDRAARLVRSDRIVTVITAGQQPHLAYEARRGIPGTVLVQPENKETAPGLLLPLLWVARRDPAASVVVFPSDHFVWEEERFAAHVHVALMVAARWPDRLAVLGVEADGPEIGYGWIAPGDPIGANAEAELYAVRRFWEKPDQVTAAHLFAQGCFWNTLVLVGRLQAYLGMAAACIPQVLAPLRLAAEHLGRPTEAETLGAAYSQFPPTNVSHTLLAGSASRLMVLPARRVGWSDWGDPDRIMRTLHRFDRHPPWMPAFITAQQPPAAEACAGEGLRGAHPSES